MLRPLYRLSDRFRQRHKLRNLRPDQALGRRGEDLAHRLLQRSGFIVVARNYVTISRSGEIDLIAWEGKTLVIIEVKSRETGEYGAPDRAIDADKKAALVRAAREYARRANIPWEQVRFDVVTIVFSTPPGIKHYRAAFRPM